MALIFCDGFDDGLTLLGKWTSLSGVSTGAPYGRNGSGFRFPNYTNFALRQFDAVQEHATMTVGFAYRRIGVAQNTEWKLLSLLSDSGATDHMNIRLSYDGSHRIYVYRGDTLVALDNVTLVANQWYYIEFKVTLGDANGAYELRINGQTRLSATSFDTKNGGTKTVFDSIRFASGMYNPNEAHIDDVYVCNGAGATNNTFLGDTVIETLLPNGNGNSSQLVGSDADGVDNYQLVDEAIPSTTDYVVGANVNDKDTYTFGNMVRTSGSVKGVMITSYANKSDALPRTIKNVSRSGGTEVTGASNTLATTWTPLSTVQETDPNGGGAWTIGSVNSAEFGVEVDS